MRPHRTSRASFLAVVAAALGLGLTAGSASAAGPDLALPCTAADAGHPLRVTCTVTGEGAHALPVSSRAIAAAVEAVASAGGQNRTWNGISNYWMDVGPAGGRGAEVAGDIAFPAGTTVLHVLVGGLAGGSAGNKTRRAPSFNGGGAFGDVYSISLGTFSYTWYPGAGGGATDVRTIAPGQPGSLESRLLVAGGGGGGGGAWNTPGGAGGDAGQSGGGDANPGGGAGTQSAGGAPGAGGGVGYGGGSAGSLGQGGYGGDSQQPAGGGGGGYYGGGGGSADYYHQNTNGGGGGGGGSNLVPLGGSAAVTSDPAGSTVSYDRVATTASLMVSDTDVDYGDPVTLTAHADATEGAPDGGTVQFRVDGAALGAPVALNIADGNAALTTVVAGGTHTLTASYSGNVTYGPDTSPASAPVTVHQVASATVLTASTPTSSYIHPMTLTATVTAVGDVPAAGGTVQFYDGDTALGAPVPVTSGAATKPVSFGALTEGVHSLRASYSGSDGTAASASSSLAHTAAREPVSVALRTTGASTVAYGANLTFTATVYTGTWGGATPFYDYIHNSYWFGQQPGSLQLYDGDTAVGQPVALHTFYPTYDPWFGPDRVAMTLYAPASVGGAHEYRAVFSGNPAVTGATSAGNPMSYSTVTVNNVPTTTAVTAVRANSQLGQSVALQAHVAPADGRDAAGAVRFTDNGQPFGAAQAVDADGGAQLTSSGLALGDHDIRAVFTSSDPYANGSTSAAVARPVTRLLTGTSVTSSPTAPKAGDAVSLDARVVVPDAPVTGAGSESATGDVVFYDAGQPIGSVPLGPDGHASLSLARLDVGGHAITVAYSGAVNWAPSGTDPVALVVGQVRTALALTVADPDSAGGRTLTATLTPASFGSGAVPSGEISYYDGDTLLGHAALKDGTSTASGAAALTIPALTVGSHALQAVYDGDQAFIGTNSAARSLVVAAPADPAKPDDGAKPDPAKPDDGTKPDAAKPNDNDATANDDGAGAKPLRSGRVAILSERRPVAGRDVDVRLYCAGAGARRCQGVLRLPGGPAVRYALSGGQVRTVRVRVPAALGARVRRDWAVNTRLTATHDRLAGDTQRPQPTTKRITLTKGR